VPTCCQIYTHIQGVSAERLTAARDEVEKKYGIRVFGGIRPWQTLDEMEADWTLIKLRDNLLEEIPVMREQKPEKDSEKDHHFFEWMIGNQNMDIGDDVFAKGWKALCQLVAANH